jgi:OOP family OmpA-OmpF porin
MLVTKHTGALKMINKKILGVVALGLSAIAINTYAAATGPYIGGQVGYGNVDGKDRSSGNLHTEYHANNLTGRLYAGYQFDPNFGAEIGYTKFGSVTEKFKLINIPVNSTLKTNVVDIVGKAIYPIANQVSLYGKLGAAYVMQDFDVNMDKIKDKGLSKVTSSHDHKLLPTASVGLAYAFNDNVSADLSYTRIQKIGDTPIKSINFAGLGLTYNFG